MKPTELLFQGKKVKLVKHPSIEEPHCPFCGSKLRTMKTENGFVTGAGLDWLLFCKNCNTMWYKTTTYFSLKKIDLQEWGFELRNSRDAE